MYFMYIACGVAVFDAEVLSAGMVGLFCVDSKDRQGSRRPSFHCK